jgi:hypothetical protein
MMPWRVSDGISLTPLHLHLPLRRHCTQFSLLLLLVLLRSLVSSCQSRRALPTETMSIRVSPSLPSPRIWRSLFHPPTVALCPSFSATFLRSDKSRLRGIIYWNHEVVTHSKYIYIYIGSTISRLIAFQGASDRLFVYCFIIDSVSIPGCAPPGVGVGCVIRDSP